MRLTEVSASENGTARATCHIVESVGGPVPADDGGQDVIKGVNVFEGNQPIPEQPPRLVRHHLQHAVCHVGLSCRGEKKNHQANTHRHTEYKQKLNFKHSRTSVKLSDVPHEMSHAKSGTS